MEKSDKTKRRILVMEDHKSLLDLYVEILELSNYEVDGASTIENAQEFLAKNAYDVFICDVFMGRQNSLEMLKQVIPTLKETHVVMLSGTGQLNQLADDLGVEFFLSKPINIQDLIGLVARLAPHKKPTIIDKDKTD